MTVNELILNLEYYREKGLGDVEIYINQVEEEKAKAIYQDSETERVVIL